MRLFLSKRSDDSLMKAFAKGNAQAFNELYGRHKDALYRFLLRASPSQTIAEDLAQETWAAMIKRSAGYQPQGYFKTWLFTIARHKLIDLLRSQNYRINDASQADNDMDALAAEPRSSALSELTVRRLLAKIKQLPSEQREAFVLKEEGFSLLEIARITGAEPETVKSRIRYARTRLRNDISISKEVV